MQFTTLPGTGISVSRLCLGTMTFGSPVAEPDAIRLVHDAAELGVNFIDTANMYEGYNRSSIDAAINALLLWIGDIPSLTAEHRLIYRQDQDKVNAYKEWKSLMRKQFSTSKEKHGSYDAAAIAEEIRTTIKSIMVPKIE